MIETTHDDEEELLPLVDEDGRILGAASRRECHDGSKKLHPVVHLHVFDEQGRLYLQKRPAWKDIQPGKWDTSVGGHISLGENVEQALKRETEEEIGLTDFQPVALRHYVYESVREKELVYAFKTVYKGEPHPSAEVAEGRFWTKQEIQDCLGKEVFTPNFENEFRQFVGDLMDK